jgi:type II secretory pathway pseudopilin PulG
MRHASTSGYAMAALLVGLSVMSIMLGAALPVWQTAITREREAELIFRGEQYAHAISLVSMSSQSSERQRMTRGRCWSLFPPYSSCIHRTSSV